MTNLYTVKYLWGVVHLPITSGGHPGMFWSDFEKSWRVPRVEFLTLQCIAGVVQTKFISSLDIAYIKFGSKNDQTKAQHLFLIIFCIFFSTFKKPADPNSKKN